MIEPGIRATDANNFHPTNTDGFLPYKMKPDAVHFARQMSENFQVTNRIGVTETGEKGAFLLIDPYGHKRIISKESLNMLFEVNDDVFLRNEVRQLKAEVVALRKQLCFSGFCAEAKESK